MKGLSLFQRTASRLIWLRYVCQDGGTVSKAYIFYERSLIWLNNLTILPTKVSSPPQLMWLSLCLNKITQMHYAIFVIFLFLYHQGMFALFSPMFFPFVVGGEREKWHFLQFWEGQITIRAKQTVHFALCEIIAPRAASQRAQDDLGNRFHKIKDKHLSKKIEAWSLNLMWELLLSAFEEQRSVPIFGKS